MRVAPWIVLGIAGIALTACEEHPQRVARRTPEYLHEALTGDVNAQARLAQCLQAGSACLDLASDPPMACAWRGVRLASRSPLLSLADAEAYRAACAGGDGTFRQRAAVAQDDFTRRLYGRSAPRAPPPQEGVLYPSVETVRGRINVELRAGSRPVLPPFGSAAVVRDQGRLAWKTCSPSVCLEAVSPDFGGGLYSYRVVATGMQDSARPLAARLAAAGLDAPAVGEPLASSAEAPPGLAAGPVCWTIGRARGDAAFAGAALGAC